MNLLALARLAVKNPVLATQSVLLKIILHGRIKPSNMKTLLWDVLPVRTRARHQELTLLRSIDHHSTISESLLSVTCQAAAEARSIDLSFLDERAREKAYHPEIAALLAGGSSCNIWPGEHYRLLAALARTRQARRVVEIGTYWGAGALALRAGMQSNGEVTTYDVVPWDSFQATLFRPIDFKAGLRQVVGDLQDPAFFASQKSLIEKADIIFMDAAKDGEMERHFLEAFDSCNFQSDPLLVIDDIHLWSMLDIWDEIRWPKMDISCFGHYTGTGLVELPSKR